MPPAAGSFAATPRARTFKVIAGLGATQLIGWGTTFTPLIVLGTTVSNDLHLPRELVFSGITIQLLVSALIAPRLGRLVDRHGARRIMLIGSCIAAAAMLAMSVSRGFLSYGFAWALIGLATPMMLTNAAMPGLVEIVGRDARRAITALTLVTGLTSTVFLPLTSILTATAGWRSAYLVFGFLHLAICLPIHFFVLDREPPAARLPSGPSHPIQDGALLPAQRRLGLGLLAAWSCTEGIITWGLNMQILDVFTAHGVSWTAAIAAWSLAGPAQSSARLVELLLGGRYPLIVTVFLAAVLPPLAFLILLIAGVSVASATAYTVCFGIGHGFFAIARNTLPLILFGQKRYGAYMGALTLPQNLVNAAAPVLFAAVLSRLSPTAALWLGGAAAVTGLVAVLLLAHHFRDAIAKTGR